MKLRIFSSATCCAAELFFKDEGKLILYEVGSNESKLFSPFKAENPKPTQGNR